MFSRENMGNAEQWLVDEAARLFPKSFSSAHRDGSWRVASFRKGSRHEGAMLGDRAVETVTVADGLVGSEEGDPGGKQGAEAVHAPSSVAIDISPTRWASRRSSAPGL